MKLHFNLRTPCHVLYRHWAIFSCLRRVYLRTLWHKRTMDCGSFAQCIIFLHHYIYHNAVMPHKCPFRLATAENILTVRHNNLPHFLNFIPQNNSRVLRICHCLLCHVFITKIFVPATNYFSSIPFSEVCCSRMVVAVV